MSQRELELRRRVEALIGVIAPGLDLLLAAGERFSRLSGPDPASDQWSPRRLRGEDSRRVTSIGR